MTGMMRVPRSRGGLSGVLLVLLGVWGGLVPFVGPHFHYSYTPGVTWSYSSGRLWLEVLPAAATVLGGLIVLASRVRPVAVLGAWLAVLSGAWFAVGNVLSVLWMKNGVNAAGVPLGSTVSRVTEQIGYFTGLGVVIVFLAALALGRFTVVGVRETRQVAREQEVAAAETAAEERAAAESATVTAPAASTPAADAEPVTSTPATTSATPSASAAQADADRAAADRADAEKTDADRAAATRTDAGQADADDPGKVTVTS
jgi:hypothetical protein